jgi:hypothetical protein
MALQKGRVAIPLSKGINQKIDPKQEPPGSLKELENIQVDKFGEIEKRDGYEKIQGSGVSVPDSTYMSVALADGAIPISNMQGIASFKNDLYILTNTTAMSIRPSFSRSVEEGSYSPAKIETSKLTQQLGFTASNVNSVAQGDFLYTVYSLQSGTVQFPYISVRNLNDDTSFIDFASIGTSAYSRPKIVFSQGKIIKFVVEKSGTDYHIAYHVCDPLEWGELVTSTSWTRITQTHSDQIYSVAVNKSKNVGMLVHKEHSAGKAEAFSFFLDPDDTTSPLALKTDNAFTSTATGITAVDIQPILYDPASIVGDKSYFTGTAPEKGGFVEVYANATHIYAASYGPDGENQYLDYSVNHAHSTEFDLALGPQSVTVHTLKNYEFGATTIGYMHKIYASFALTGTATGTSTNKLVMIDNSTGTYATDDILASDFSGGSDYIKTAGSATAGFTGITYANFPSWNKQRIAEITAYYNESGTGTSSENDQTPKFLVGATLVANPYSPDDGQHLILPVGFSAENQNSYFLYTPSDSITARTAPVALISYGTASSDYNYSSGADGYPSVPSLTSSSGTQIISTLTKGRVESNDNSFFSLSVPSVSKITYDSNLANQSVEVSGNLIVAGSQVFSSDQSRFSEHGFLQGPPRLYIHTQGMSTGGTVFASGTTRLYKAVYRYEDQSGNIHRSAESPQLTVGLSAGYDHVNIIVPMVNFTDKYQYSTFIELYRTVNNGTIFYRVSDLSVSSTVSASRNEQTNNYIKIKDVQTDDELQQQELIYTTGGVIENTPVGSASIVEEFKNRVFLAGVELSPHLLYYSKTVQAGVFQTTPVEFSNSLSLEVPPSGGKIVALKRMDDKLIIFKERAIYMLTGEGPNNLGEQNDYIEPQLITSDVGCKFTNSVAFMPKGLMFMSQKGIFLLNRSLGLEYIGAPAEDYKDLTITKTTVVAKKSEVRFLASDGPTAIYNYFLNMWYTYGNHRGNSSAMLGDDYCLATFKNEVYKQVSTTASFGGSMVPIKLETGWLSFAGIQGFQRVYRMLLLGEYKSPHKLLIKIAYNYDDVFTQEKLIDVTSYTESYTYGNPSTGTQNTYGDPSGTSAIAYGGKDNTQYQIRLNFAKQKCESIKIQITEVEGSNSAGNAESAGPGFTLSNLSFIVGTKEGDFKIKQSRVFGSTSIT